MSNNVHELKKIIDEFERNLKKIRESTEREVRRARAILKRLEREDK